jgi:hypothetical protein
MFGNRRGPLAPGMNTMGSSKKRLLLSGWNMLVTLRFSMLRYRFGKLPAMPPPSFRRLVTAPTGRVKMVKRKSTNSLSTSANSTRRPFLSMKSFKLTMLGVGAVFAAMLGASVNDYESSNGIDQYLKRRGFI